MPYQPRRQSGRWIFDRRSRPGLPIGVESTDSRLASEDDIDKPEVESPSIDPKRRAKGRALVRTDGEEAEAATIRSSDVRAAREDWRAKTIPGYAGLIDAELDPEPTEDD